MGTHASTKVMVNGKVVVNLYRQFDGYAEGHGRELAEFLKDIRLVNGISADNKDKVANGMDDLAAQIVAHFKAQSPVGNFYLSDLDNTEEYDYTVYEKDGQIRIAGRWTIFLDTDVVVNLDETPSKFLGSIKAISGVAKMVAN